MSQLKFRLATSGSQVQDASSGISNAFRSILNAPIAAAEAAEIARNGESQRAMQEAQASLFRNKSMEIDDARERATPGAVLRNAAMIHNVAPDQQKDFLSFMQSGQLGGQYVTPADGVGPVLPTPGIYTDGTVQKVARTAGFANQGLAAGDKNIENLAKVEKLYRDMGLGDDVLAGRRTAGSVGQAQAAMEGKKVFDNIGNTGMGYNQFTGEEQQLSEGLRIIFGDESAAEIKTKEAQAGASRASAASSYASAAKTNQERTDGLGRGGQKAPSGYRWTADGGLEVIPGGPADARNKTGAPTEDERKAAGWVTQAQFAFDNMEKVLEKAPGAASPNVIQSMVGAIPGVGQSLSNSMKSEPRQQFEQAAESFAEAALRAATGAGVNRDEAIQKVRELTPQIGDKPGNIRQKREALTVYLDSLKLRAGRALPDGGAAPRPAPAPARGGASGGWDDGAGSSAQRISSDAEYNALPSGAVFIGPDNQQRRKP